MDISGNYSGGSMSSSGGGGDDQQDQLVDIVSRTESSSSGFLMNSSAHQFGGFGSSNNNFSDPNHLLIDLSSFNCLQALSQSHSPNSPNPNFLLLNPRSDDIHQPNSAASTASTAVRSDHQQQQPPNYTHVSTSDKAVSGSQSKPTGSSSSKKPGLNNLARNSKKRTRASRRAPTTVLTTDTSNFRAMVQEFTGIPAPPFSAGGASSAYSRRLDTIFGGGISGSGSFFPIRPSAQKVSQTPFPSSLLMNPTNYNMSNFNFTHHPSQNQSMVLNNMENNTLPLHFQHHDQQPQPLPPFHSSSSIQFVAKPSIESRNLPIHSLDQDQLAAGAMGMSSQGYHLNTNYQLDSSDGGSSRMLQQPLMRMNDEDQDVVRWRDGGNRNLGTRGGKTTEVDNSWICPSD